MDFLPNVAHMKSYLLDTTYQIKVDAYADFYYKFLQRIQTIS